MHNAKKRPMSPKEAGRLGGQKTAQKGSEYYKKIGRKGGRVTQHQRSQQSVLHPNPE